MSVVDDIATMQNETTYNKANASKAAAASSSSSDTSTGKSSSTNSTTDENTFLSLMLQEMQNQDPTQPMDNQQWLSQLAQYSSLEQMTAVNTNLKGLATSLSSLSSTVSQGTSINQTLSLIGKNVDITDPSDSTKTITGTVSEATFNNGTGEVKVNGTYYPISYVKNIRDAAATTGGNTATTGDNTTTTDGSTTTNAT